MYFFSRFSLQRVDLLSTGDVSLRSADAQPFAAADGWWADAAITSPLSIAVSLVFSNPVVSFSRLVHFPFGLRRI